MLAARNVTVEAGGATILNGVGFTARPGEITAIVGPNGSGKTTLLRALTGEIPARGEVVLDGLTVGTGNAATLAARRGVLPQVSHLAFPFTVTEVVRIGHGAGAHADQPDLPWRALERVGMAHMAGRFYQDLSGGEQQRVQLARVLAQVWEPVTGDGPAWLFLDEPVSSLDIGHQLTVMRLARDFAARGGGVVAVMHDLNLTAMFAGHVAVMEEGRIAAAGPAPEVLTSSLLSQVYDCTLRINTPPRNGTPYILPHAAGDVV